MPLSSHSKKTSGFGLYSLLSFRGEVTLIAVTLLRQKTSDHFASMFAGFVIKNVVDS